jgi:hypothetical protein
MPEAHPSRAASRSPLRFVDADFALGIDGPKGLVVAGRSGLLLTADAGHHWRDITPRALGDQLDHGAGIVASGSAIWLEFEGDSRFDFITFSADSGHRWHTATFAGPIVGLTASNPSNVRVEVDATHARRLYYESGNAGGTWHRSSRPLSMHRPTEVVGNRITIVGPAPDHLAIDGAVHAVGGLTWAQGRAPSSGTYSHTYLLSSTDLGKRWTLVQDHGD